ncbi:MAG: hypothetical protein EOM91_09670 [Sphingobacteriia bacterium]|nr:hypothetical protein [Sphingobacteriia bacterium]NCC38629.1 hypothetical protein [Gammaproteobacteria bacterium]
MPNHNPLPMHVLIAMVALGVTGVEADSQMSHIIDAGECVELEIDAQDEWNRDQRRARDEARLRYLLVKGVTYTFEVTDPEPTWQDWWISADPEQGWPRWLSILGWPLHFFNRHPESNWFTLVGAIGTDPAHFFKIGMRTRHSATATGEFGAFANDLPSRIFYGNNRGTLNLRICRTP